MKTLPKNHSFFWIFLSTALISGVAWMGWLYYIKLKEKNMQDEQYQIVALVQSCPQNDGLKTVYLAELLNLSIDRPPNLYQFNLAKGCKRLLASPLMKTVTLRKILPGTLFVEYEVRQPVAFLGDYTNTAMDQNGYLFPFSPFFTPKKLPVVYLGLEKMDVRWGQSLWQNSHLQLAWQVMDTLQELGMDSLFLKQVDVSQAFADSFGQRQIVLILEELPDLSRNEIKTVYLRLNPNEYRQNLANYKVLRESHVNEPVGSLTIDMRVSHLAFVKKM